jgi:two-component system, NarL family, nitrate/nitrite response regulator NarL
MSLNYIDENFSSYGAQEVPQIPTILICGSSFVREGFKHILSDTCFKLHDGKIDTTSSFPHFPDAETVLFILETTRDPSDMAELVRGLKAQCATARIVLLADSADLELVVLAYEAGAAGVLETTTGLDVMIKSLELIVLGELVFPTTPILNGLRHKPNYPEHEDQHEVTGAKTDTSSLETRGLSNREQEILRHLMEGAPNKIIARKLGMAEATVKVHIKAILRKIHAQNRTQAAMWANRHLQSAYDGVGDRTSLET